MDLAKRGRDEDLAPGLPAGLGQGQVEGVPHKLRHVSHRLNTFIYFSLVVVVLLYKDIYSTFLSSFFPWLLGSVKY